jgi:hypothetical protein
VDMPRGSKKPARTRHRRLLVLVAFGVIVTVVAAIVLLVILTSGFHFWVLAPLGAIVNVWFAIFRSISQEETERSRVPPPARPRRPVPRPTRPSASRPPRVVPGEMKAPSSPTSRAKAFVSDGMSEPCSVCRHPIMEGDTILVCPHCYSEAHKEHLLNWLKRKTSCPICRAKLR